MKFFIDAKEFAGALKAVAGCVAKKSHVPAASHVLINADEGALTLSACNLEQYISLTPQGPGFVVKEPGLALVPYDELVHIVAAMSGEVKIFTASATKKKQTADFIFIESGDSSFKLLCLPVEDAPVFEFAGDMHECHGIAGTMRRIMYAALQADADQLKGLCLMKEHITATDGYRIAREYTPLAMPGQEAIMPLSAVKMLLQLNPPASIGFDERTVCFKAEEYCLMSRLVDKKYPDAGFVLGDTPGQDIELDDGDCEELEAVLDKAAILFDGAPGLLLSCAGGTVRASIQGNAGTYYDTVHLDSHVRDFNVMVNPVYLRDALRACGLKSQLHIPEAPDKPILIRACNGVHAIMPMISN